MINIVLRLGSENNAVEDKVGKLKSLPQLHYFKSPHVSMNREPPEENMWSPQILQEAPPCLKACLPTPWSGKRAEKVPL